MNYLRYTAVFLVVAVGTAIAVTVLRASLGTTLGSSAQVIVPSMIAALMEGRAFARTEKRRPSQREAWVFTGNASLLAVALNLILAYAASAVLPEFAKIAAAPVFSMAFVVLLLIYAAGYVICNRFFVGLGASNELSAMHRRGELD
ncbi:ABZJ_00895 family protein [Roseovarius salinarum]|uniref:ABZJ_00895 family protein n=1 Tax=Roseovarius salinarum TaxID=1981892 RepID=UPI000C343230|nr:ABZJ_00895 family protein [Roseovarius salinarum]